MTSRPVLLCAGGTGGHLFPAEALAHALRARGVAVELVTDERALRYGGSFPADAMHSIQSATPRGGSLVSRGVAVARLGFGVVQSLALIRKTKPLVVIGFGGYPTAPPLVAAFLTRTPCALHEANAVMGKANRFLSRMVDAIAAGFPLAGAAPSLRAKITVTGNPVRPSVLEAAKTPFPSLAEGRLRLLVTGGSQGARVFADVAPAAIAALPPHLRARLEVTQQARPEDLARVTTAYQKAGVAALVAPFFSDLPQRMADAHLVVARSGASTVSELAVIGRPSILVPLPHALDQDQANNAAILARVDASELVRQQNFTPRYLTERLAALLDDPFPLIAGAKAAHDVGAPRAAERLADLVLELAQTKSNGALAQEEIQS